MWFYTMNLSASSQLQINQKLRILLRLGNFGQSQRRGKDEFGASGIPSPFFPDSPLLQELQKEYERKSDKYAFLSMTNNLSNTTRFYTTINVLIQLDLKSKVH